MKKNESWAKVPFYINAYAGVLDGWRCAACTQIVYTIEEEIWGYLYCPFCGQKVLKDAEED